MLRRAVPTLPQSEDGGAMGQPKPSKTMVLAAAIDYIKKVEKQLDMYKGFNERLRRIRGMKHAKTTFCVVVSFSC